MVRDTCFIYRVAIHISTYTDPSHLSCVMVKVFHAVAVEHRLDQRLYIILILSTQHDGAGEKTG